MTGSATSSTRTSSLPCHVTARMVSSWSSRGPVSQPALVEAEEALLIRANLGDRHLAEAGLGERAERLDVALGVGPARRALRGVLDGDVGRGLLEVGRGGQILMR